MFTNFSDGATIGTNLMAHIEKIVSGGQTGRTLYRANPSDYLPNQRGVGVCRLDRVTFSWY